MSATVVIDSSVAYKWFYRDDEPGIDIAEQLLTDQMEGRVLLAAPATLPVELANALRYSGLTADRTLEILDLIDAVNIQLHGVTKRRIARAVALAFAHGMSVYDALFLELAEHLSCPLVTSDRRAFEGVEAGVDIRLV